MTTPGLRARMAEADQMRRAFTDSRISLHHLMAYLFRPGYRFTVFERDGKTWTNFHLNDIAAQKRMHRRYPETCARPMCNIRIKEVKR